MLGSTSTNALEYGRLSLGSDTNVVAVRKPELIDDAALPMARIKICFDELRSSSSVSQNTKPSLMESRFFMIAAPEILSRNIVNFRLISALNLEIFSMKPSPFNFSQQLTYPAP